HVSFFFQTEDGIRDLIVTGVQTCALPISQPARSRAWFENGPSRWTRSSDCLARSKLPDSNNRVPSTRFDLSRIARPAGSPADSRSEERRVGKVGWARCAAGTH